MPRCRVLDCLIHVYLFAFALHEGSNAKVLCAGLFDTCISLCICVV